MKSKYQEYIQLNLTQIAGDVLDAWEKDNTFERSITNREGKPTFVFYEGPPSANGMPGIHHVISRTLKDLVCRYKTMRGFQVKRKGGWDTHGLPVELGVEKLLGITKEDIGKKITVEEYNATCRREVLKFKDKWDELTQKMGYWVDLDHPYITFENNYIESLWWCLKELYKKGFLYESVSIQPYSPAAGTGLSSHELNQPGTYKDVKDTSVVAMFKATKNDRLKIENADENIFFLAWTTTPWTLPSNLGLTVGTNIDYVLIKTFNPYTHLPVNVILAKALINKYFKTENENGDFSSYDETAKLIPWKILKEFKGKELEGLTYEQLLPGEANTLEKIREITPGAQPFKVVTGDFVTTEDGTGIVHTAPAFGADDFKAGKKNNLGILTLVDKEGKFVDGVGEFSGRFVKNYKDDPNYTDVNVDISVKLKKENRAFKVEKYEHNYPHCWRTDKPIIYYPLDAWFIKTTAAKERMIELNNTINWKPASTGTGRFGNWLENMVDWNLSRSRFWGTPLPVWRTRDDTNHYSRLNQPKIDSIKIPSYEICIGSKQEFIECTREIENKSQIFNGFFVNIQKINNDSNLLKSILDKWQENYDFEKTDPYTYVYTKELYNLIESNQKITLENLVDANLKSHHLKEFLARITENDLENIDLHKPTIDNIIFSNHDGEILVRVPDLIDVWFDSGAMPYAQWHFPFENQEEFKKNFPADFIAEGVDQTRGWFYTLHVLAALLFDSVAYKTVVSNGLVLDKNGVKMSKRLGNIVDPFETLEIFGPDATRWYLITNASPWDSLKFDLEGIKEVQRKFFGTLYNTYQFFALYANVDGFTFKEKYIPVKERPEIDQWIISSLNSLIESVTKNLDDYEPTQAGRAIEYFLDEHLSNWYVRLSRRRFWKGEYENDKICAYQTLYECLQALSMLIAPIAPFFADWLFTNLNTVTKKLSQESVHHTDFPTTDSGLIDMELEERMQLAQDISSLILSLRKKVNLPGGQIGIKVRQPLQKVIIPAIDDSFAQKIKMVEDIIKSETNIKEVDILQANNNFIKKKAKANYKTLGKKLGAKMKWAAEKIQQLGDDDITRVLQGDFILNTDYEQKKESPIIITAEDIEVSTNEIPGFEVAVKGNLTVALDIILTENLKNEGFAREFINRIQTLRKEKNFDLTDKIVVNLVNDEVAMLPINEFNTYICAEILADKLEFVPKLVDGITIDVNNHSLTVTVTKKAK
ncbi:isoleucine--tRNA ligase [Ginsengibacter hankyongi]|uniref:Isoleucine--tRNA ligase n=1 Tax=Ginsengibacter hankyongi TaxID=2607284 RepID=A0A5J5II40_9BACT|nr:isoleucine--tRNA ligase [Ginsengibacter hankyongi]KAA9039353.1 isoleucine--tRNA ligase [Ginsengibacter hankyongi]